MPGMLYETGPAGIWSFLVVTLLLGGAAAFASGRAIAETWRPFWQLPLYMLLLAAAVRFVQFSVFGAPLMSAPNLAVDLVIVLALGWLGHALTRRRQMAAQYGWVQAPEAG